jgi:hypothetical protein
VIKKLSIGKKLALISVALSVVTVGLSAFMLFELRDTMIDGRKVKLRALVESAVNVVDHFSQMEASGPRVPQGPMNSGSISQSVRLISDIPPAAVMA